jgi:cell shape-determining protein MreC
MGEAMMSDEEKTLGSNAKNDQYHLIAYHLRSLDYGKLKVQQKVNQVASSAVLRKANETQLKEVISKLKELIDWHVKFVEYHQLKAIERIPESERTRRHVNQRSRENESYKSIFLDLDDPGTNAIESFKTQHEVAKKRPPDK